MSYVSHADIGGQPCREQIGPEANEPLFHAAWEARVQGLTIAMGATRVWNLDMSRAARETLARYSELSYYAKWLSGLERLLIEHRLVTPEELDDGRSRGPGRAVPAVLAASQVAGMLARGAPTARPATAAARFALGARVRTRSSSVPHHTRLPGYARGRVGLVERVHGAHVFPDDHARGRGESPQWLYTVVFAGRELWGEAAAPGLTVSVDAWESYLEPL